MTARWYVLTILLLVAACHPPAESASLDGTGDSQLTSTRASAPAVGRPRAPAGTEQIAANGD